MPNEISEHDEGATFNHNSGNVPSSAPDTAAKGPSAMKKFKSRISDTSS